MATKDNSDRTGTQGWEQFLAEKKRMLDAFSRAKEHSSIHEVGTQHGFVAEAAVKDWLRRFLPKKFGVTSGYVISQGIKDGVKAPHFDVIIYNQIESPVLWTESFPGLQDDGVSKAIPAEFVLCVIEIKSSFTSKAINAVFEHMSDLEPILKNVDKGNEHYRNFLPQNFFWLPIFFDLNEKDIYCANCLNDHVSFTKLRGYYGSVILRALGLKNDNSTGLIQPVEGKDKILGTCSKEKESLLGSPLSDSALHTDNKHHSVMLTWSEANFATAAFDILAHLQGTYRTGYVSSMHGLNWNKPAQTASPIVKK